jgi:hypothetical protein
MVFYRILLALIGPLLAFLFAGCGSDAPSTESGAGSPTPASKTDPQYCAHNVDPACARGSYLGPFVAVTRGGGHWDANGAPVNGGPTGADGSTGNNLTQEYCARNEDPACPAGSYVGPNAIKNPDGSPSYVVCEGTICTNPNHGAANPPGTWGPDGRPINGGPTGADGSTGNNLTHEYCAQNQDPGCPAGTFVGPNAIKSPDGTNSYVPCEGTICTNPNHGAGDPPATDATTGEEAPDSPAPPDPGPDGTDGGGSGEGAGSPDDTAGGGN